MGIERIIAAAAAATPIARNYFHYRPGSSDSEEYHSDSTVIPTRPSRPALQDDEMARRPLLASESQSLSRQSSSHSQTYGTILNEGPSSFRTSPERHRRDSWLHRVPEEVAADEGEDEDEDDAEAEEWDLAEQGYYRGSYKRTIAFHALVPATSILVFVLFATLPTWVWPVRYPSPPTLPRSIPSPVPEFILSAALWSLSHHLRVPLYNLASLICPSGLDTVLFNTLHAILSQVLRSVAMAAFRVRHEMTYPLPTWRDGVFHTVWWLALGWGFAEAATSIAQMFQQLSLYRSVMVPEDRVREILAQSKAQAQAQWAPGGLSRSGSSSREYMPLSPRTEQPPPASTEPATNANGTGARNSLVRREGGTKIKSLMSLEEAIQSVVEQDVEQLIHLQEREELEEVYGLPVIYIPVFVPCLQRLDSFLFSLGFTLILAWAYLLSPLSFPPDYETPPVYSNHALVIVFPLVVVVHLFLSLLHSPLVLPRIGVHTTAYVGLLVGLGGFFTGLGLWGALS